MNIFDEPTIFATRQSAKGHRIEFHGWKAIALVVTWTVGVGLLGYAIGIQR